MQSNVSRAGSRLAAGLPFAGLLSICLPLLLAHAVPAWADPAAEWQAEWIWSPGEASPKNAYLRFRKPFELARLPAKAELHISAHDRYRLFVNGAYVGRGPAPTRSDPRYQQYDTYDVSRLLRSGGNAIAVEVQVGDRTKLYVVRGSRQAEEVLKILHLTDLDPPAPEPTNKEAMW